MVTDAAALVDAELEEQLVTWAGRIAAGEAVLLQLLGEFDRRELWARQGAVSCAHWASWRLGLTLGTARERVRVARALRDLPLLANDLAQGRVSYAQVRAVSRVAPVQDERSWLDLARHCTAAQLERAVRGVGRARRAQQATPVRESARVRWEEDGTLVLTVRVAPEHASAVLEALGHAQAKEQAERDAVLKALSTEVAGDVSVETSSALAAGEPPTPYVYEEPPYSQLPPLCGVFDEHSDEDKARLGAWHEEVARRRALRDAWRAHERRVEAAARARALPTARASLADGLVRALTRSAAGAQVTVRLMVDPLSGWARTGTDELLPPVTLAAQLQVYDQGRRDRLVGPGLRALLGQVDGERCRFPGCARTRRLHAHHVRFWRDGGRTDLANLVLVCSRHHAAIHRQGFRLALAQDRTLQVHSADELAVPHHPTLPWRPAQELDSTGTVCAATLPSEWGGERMDLGYVVSVMLAHAA